MSIVTKNIKKIKYLFLAISLSLLAACSSHFTKFKKTIESADAAYNQLDLKKSRKILTAMLENDSLNNETKCKVLQRLAFQDWKYFKNYRLAKSRLMIADSIGILKSETWCILARIEREFGNYQNSLQASEEAEKQGDSDAEKTSAKLEYAQTVYDFSINNLKNKTPIDTTLLSKTSNLLIEILKIDAGSPKPSKLLLGIALLQNNGGNVLDAWKSYFHIPDINNPYPYFAVVAKDLNDVCKDWRGEKLLFDKQEKLILALSNSRLYEYAADFILFNSNEKGYSHAVLDFLTYAKYLKAVKSETNEYYRQIAIGEEKKKKYVQWLDNTRRKLWNNLSFLSGREYNEPDFLTETEKHFGARGFTGSTANYNGFELCLGHIVNKEKATVAQYGYTPEFTYTQIDMMTSNGYSSWFWEDKAIGGWATDKEVIRVREAYLSEPFNAWNLVTDLIERKKAEILINEFINQQPNALDVDKQSIGLAKKLKSDASEDLYKKLHSQGLRGDNLKLAFLSTYENYRIEASIFGHEGRHSIEEKYFPEEFKKWSNEEREFHAKLSQIIFATEPRLELAGMVTEIGESGHGLANKKIVDTAISWIKNNSKQIKGYTLNYSPFSQLYLLTNDQIKECYKSIDPLYIKAK